MIPSSFEEALAIAQAERPEDRAERLRRRDLDLLDEMRRKNAGHRIAMARKLSNLGERFQERTLETYRCPPGDPHALSVAREVVAEGGAVGVWYFGRSRAGKTHLSAGIVNALTELGIPATFVSVVQLLQQFRANYDRNGKLRINQVDITRWLADIEVLVLDDIDKAAFTAHTSEQLYALVNQRFENGGSLRRRPVIVTSNLAPAEIAIRWRNKGLDELIGDSIMHRFRELCGKFVAVECSSYPVAERAG